MWHHEGKSKQFSASNHLLSLDVMFVVKLLKTKLDTKVENHQ